jgi:flagellar biosynthesis repressor protein FlbT
MALKVDLKPHEKIVIGNVVIRNGDNRTRFFIDGDTSILREKDIIGASQATTPAKRIYFVLQLMYLDKDVVAYKETFISLVEEFMRAAPSAWPIISKITEHVIGNDIYRAIKSARDLIKYEQDLLSHELCNERVSIISEDGDKPKAA